MTIIILKTVDKKKLRKSDVNFKYMFMGLINIYIERYLQHGTNIYS